MKHKKITKEEIEKLKDLPKNVKENILKDLKSRGENKEVLKWVK